MNLNLNLTSNEMTALIENLITDKVFGCYTRQGLEEVLWTSVKNEYTHVLFMDVDYMHEANEKFGYDGVNAKINASLKVRSDDVVVSRWFSGDEIVIFVKNCDPVAMAKRVQNNFSNNGLTVTFAVGTVSDDLNQTVSVASNKVQNAKKSGNRGVVIA